MKYKFAGVLILIMASILGFAWGIKPSSVSAWGYFKGVGPYIAVVIAFGIAYKQDWLRLKGFSPKLTLFFSTENPHCGKTTFIRVFEAAAPPNESNAEDGLTASLSTDLTDLSGTAIPQHLHVSHQPPRASNHLCVETAEVYYYRVKVINDGRRAEEVEVYAHDLTKVMADGSEVDVGDFLPMNLKWAHRG